MADEQLISDIIAQVKPYTVVPTEGLTLTLQLTLDAIRNATPGVLVEAGTWMGGCSYAMALVQKAAFGAVLRPVYMFDSFAGLPPPSPRDGPYAYTWQANALATPGQGDHKNNCTATIEQAEAARAALGLTDSEAIFRPGWFHDTMPFAYRELREHKIAILRVDADWYESCRTVYNHLGPIVSHKGAVIIDDYTVWAGCARATHEFLTLHNLPWRLKGGADLYCAWMIADNTD
jgi:O-methyltransferase/8-demethyl-8-(2,3-dimethoxy-alpha-L-rhamnosyl)tetracenomycin-C 4'-O-methyltransferase